MKWKKIGDILILDNKFDVQSNMNLDEIANKHNVKTIMKVDHIYGTKREPVIKLLYGTETETINKENNCLFKLDLKKVMWSKGNNNERIRIARLVEDNETIIDMFAGIGYFSIPIGVHSNAKQIYSMEINPNSFYYLNENIKLNKIKNITPLLGDCKGLTPNYKADRIIMGYVKTTHHYLKIAVDSLNKGGIIHYHETVPEKLMDVRPINRIREASENRDVEFLKLNTVKKYSPGVFHVVCDARIN
ncbi:class I SAM-dependent methyltransferase family protein [uncultured Methanobrevibacter sp.]|uniref:class I SAM-dependent methyltransferase n=1 Tax=uncultured Methanobrevibacter sp. TaxID=253161 RepID=UPI002638F67A|nr:class I SAM-dependent methyltransferase family protein [uncultured Methanobrevibacter sp.]